MLEGAFGVRGRLRIRTVGGRIPETSNGLVMADDWRVVCRVDSKACEDSGGKEGNAVPRVTTEAREPVLGSWCRMVELAFKFRAR